MRNLFSIFVIANKSWVLLLVTIWVAQMASTNPVDAYTLFTDREEWLSAVAELPLLEENFNNIPNGEYQAGTIPSDVFTNLEIFPTNPLPMAIMDSRVIPVFNRDFSVQMLFFQPALAVGLDIINPEQTNFEYAISEEEFSGAFYFVGESETVDFLGWVADEGDSPILLTFVFFDPARRSQFAWDNLRVVPVPGISITIDIKPGSYPNSINLKSKGKVPIAILTTDDFDAYDVDTVSCEFAGAYPLRWNMEDVDHDGDYDLIMHFKTRELDMTEDSTEATIECETIYGVQITGTDSVNIVPKVKRYSKKGEKRK